MVRWLIGEIAYGGRVERLIGFEVFVAVGFWCGDLRWFD